MHLMRTKDLLCSSTSPTSESPPLRWTTSNFQSSTPGGAQASSSTRGSIGGTSRAGLFTVTAGRPAANAPSGRAAHGAGSAWRTRGGSGWGATRLLRDPLARIAPCAALTAPLRRSPPAGRVNRTTAGPVLVVRRDGRVADCTGLENRRGGDPTEGSNPSPSA